MMDIQLNELSKGHYFISLQLVHHNMQLVQIFVRDSLFYDRVTSSNK